MSSRRHKATHDTLLCSGFAYRMPYSTKSGFSSEEVRLQDLKEEHDRKQPARKQTAEMKEKKKAQQGAPIDDCKPLVSMTAKVNTTKPLREGKHSINLTGKDGINMQRAAVNPWQVPLKTSYPKSSKGSAENCGSFKADIYKTRTIKAEALPGSNSRIQALENDSRCQQYNAFILSSELKHSGGLEGKSKACDSERRFMSRNIVQCKGTGTATRDLEVQGSRIVTTGSGKGSRALNCVLSRNPQSNADNSDEDYQQIDLRTLDFYRTSKSPVENMTKIIEIVARENAGLAHEVAPILPPISTLKCTIQDRYLSELAFNPKTPVLREYARIAQASFYDLSHF